eukprot:3774928-Rhodomonas_salina.1
MNRHSSREYEPLVLKKAVLYNPTVTSVSPHLITCPSKFQVDSTRADSRQLVNLMWGVSGTVEPTVPEKPTANC